MSVVYLCSQKYLSLSIFLSIISNIPKKNTSILWLVIVFIAVNSNAQSLNKDSIFLNENLQKDLSGRKQNIYAQAKFDYGGIIPTVKEKGIEKYYGLDLRVAWQKRVNNVYSKLYNSPKFGLGFYSGAFDNNAFGEPNGLYGFVEVPIFDQRKKLNWIYSIGAGLAFNFSYYDPIDNPSNELIGSNRNVYIAFSLEGRYNITENWVAGLGFGFKHFSNGRLYLPNRGINLLPLTVTTEYNFGDNYTDIKIGKVPTFIPFNIVNIYGAAGFKNFEYGKAKYFKSTLSLNFLRQFNYKFRYGLGAEIFYTAGSLERISNDKSDFNKLFSYGISAQWEWLITDRLYIPLNFGIHLNHNVENYEKFLYQRVALRYLSGKQQKMTIGVGLKVTEFHADYVEWTIGYVFKNDKNKYDLIF